MTVALDNNKQNLAMARMVPSEAVEPAPWLPEQLSEGPLAVVHSTTYCVPWVLASKTFGFRGVIELWPHQSFGGLYQQMDGATSLILIPNSVVVA